MVVKREYNHLVSQNCRQSPIELGSVVIAVAVAVVVAVVVGVVVELR